MLNPPKVLIIVIKSMSKKGLSFMKTMLKHWMISCLLCRNLSSFMKTMKTISSWHIHNHV